MEHYNISVLEPKRLDSISTKKPQKSPIDDKALMSISEKMVEIDRAMTAFGRNNTQTTATLMSLTMLNGTSSPYRLLKQCLAEIDKRRMALKDAVYKQRKKHLKYQELRKREQTSLTLLKMEKIEADIIDTALYIEGAIKDIATHQDNYEQIRKNNNIPEDWDEADFEAAEPLFHTRRAFELLYSDLVTNGRMGKGTHEYLCQFGIHPQVALKHVTRYIAQCEEMLKENKAPNSNHLEEFLDNAANMYQDNHKEVLKRMGIERMTTPLCQYKTKP